MSTTTRKIQSRIAQKHDLEVNWLKAENFVPMQGEIIIYDIEVDKDGNTLELPMDKNTDKKYEKYFRTKPYTYERFKIGDGTKTITELPFSNNLNIDNGTGEKSLQQEIDTVSWDTNNAEVKDYVTNSKATADGAKINGTINGDKVTINVGAFGKLSTMMNGKSQTVGGKSHAEGSKTIAFENNSHAEGNDTFAAGKHSHAEGNTTAATGSGAHAEGEKTVASGAHAHAEGLETTASGAHAHAEGYNVTSGGYAAHAEGNNTKANGDNSHAEGENSTSDGKNSHAEGSDTVASGPKSHAEGAGSYSSGDSSHSEGGWTTASGYYSHAEGYNTTASGAQSHAEGIGSEASGNSSHAEGQNVKASGNYSHAEGISSVASGYGTHAEGHSTANNNYTHAEGYGTIASGNYSHVSGTWNVEDLNNENSDRGNYAVIVGNGTEANPSNAHTLDWEGNAWFAGDVTVGGAEAKTLATEDYVDEQFTILDDKILTTVDLTKVVVPLKENTLIITSNNISRDPNSTMNIERATINVKGYVEIEAYCDEDSTATADTTRVTINGNEFYSKNGISFKGIVNTMSCTINKNCVNGITFTKFLAMPNYELSGKISNAETEIENIDNRTKNISSGEGEGSLQQEIDTVSWETDNAEVKDYVAKSTPGTNNGLTINGTVNPDGTVTIPVGAFGKSSVMMNGKSQTIGGKSHAEGSKTIALENNSHAEGNATFAAGAHSHAEGNTTSAIGNSAHTEGIYSVATGDASHAEGFGSKSNGYGSHAEGLYTEAKGSYSHTEGVRTETSSDYQKVIGKGNKIESDKAFIIGNGEIDSNFEVTQRKNAMTVDWDGNIWAAGNIKVGSENKAVATEDYVEVKIADLVSTAPGKLDTLGKLADALNDNSNFANDVITELSNRYTKPEVDAKFSQLNIGRGDDEHSVQQVSTTASGSYSFAEGHGTTAEGAESHAEGHYTKAAKTGSHAEGYSAHALGDYGSHAEGFKNYATGDYGSHAEGRNTLASGISSHAEGNSTIASGVDQHVQGKFNISDSTSAFIIGNGSGEDEYDAETNELIKQNRSNALTVDWKGNGWFAGDVKVGAEAKTLATVDSLSDAIKEHDDSLLSHAAQFATKAPSSDGVSADRAVADEYGNNIYQTYQHIKFITDDELDSACLSDTLYIGQQLNEFGNAIIFSTQTEYNPPSSDIPSVYGADYYRQFLISHTGTFYSRIVQHDNFWDSDDYSPETEWETLVYNKNEIDQLISSWSSVKIISDEEIDSALAPDIIYNYVNSDSYAPFYQAFVFCFLDDAGNVDKQMAIASDGSMYSRLYDYTNPNHWTDWEKFSYSAADINFKLFEINEKITNNIANTYTKEEIDDVINGLTDEIEEKLQNNVNNPNIQLASYSPKEITLDELENLTTFTNYSETGSYIRVDSNNRIAIGGETTQCIIKYRGYVEFELDLTDIYTNVAVITLNGNSYNLKELANNNFNTYTFKGNLESDLGFYFSADTVVFNSFKIFEDRDGLMSSKDKEKLDNLDEITTKLNDKIAFVNSNKIVLDKTVTLPGSTLIQDGLQDSIYLKYITNTNTVVFGDEFAITSRYFGYIGIENLMAGSHYLLVAKINVDTDFDMSKARVQEFYSSGVGFSPVPNNTIIGTPKNGINYILYSFEGALDKPIKGFYFDAQSGNNPSVKLKLLDIKLYKQELVQYDIDMGGLKDWKCEIYQKNDLVKSSIGQYALIQDGTTLFASSLSSAMEVDILLYKSLEETFTSKEEFTELSSTVASKGITFMQYTAGTKIPLEKDCVYYLRCNADTIQYYKNGEKLYYYKDGEKIYYYPNSFGDGFVMMASNIFQGAYVNSFAAPNMGSIFSGAISMNSYTITTQEKDDVYAMSTTDAVSVWKLQA